MLMKDQNFHAAKKRIVVCLLFMLKYFLICILNSKDCKDSIENSFLNFPTKEAVMNSRMLTTVLLIAFFSNAVAQTKLFNGKNLRGWKVHGTEKWYVDNGELVCESGPDKQYGYLASEKDYKDFELTVEFKQESNGNSGVFFHSSIEGTKITGWQAEVAPKGRKCHPRPDPISKIRSLQRRRG